MTSRESSWRKRAFQRMGTARTAERIIDRQHCKMQTKQRVKFELRLTDLQLPPAGAGQSVACIAVEHPEGRKRYASTEAVPLATSFTSHGGFSGQSLRWECGVYEGKAVQLRLMVATGRASDEPGTPRTPRGQLLPRWPRTRAWEQCAAATLPLDQLTPPAGGAAGSDVSPLGGSRRASLASAGSAGMLTAASSGEHASPFMRASGASEPADSSSAEQQGPGASTQPALGGGGSSSSDAEVAGVWAVGGTQVTRLVVHWGPTEGAEGGLAGQLLSQEVVVVAQVLAPRPSLSNLFGLLSPSQHRETAPQPQGSSGNLRALAASSSSPGLSNVSAGATSTPSPGQSPLPAAQAPGGFSTPPATPPAPMPDIPEEDQDQEASKRQFLQLIMNTLASAASLTLPPLPADADAAAAGLAAAPSAAQVAAAATLPRAPSTADLAVFAAAAGLPIDTVKQAAATSRLAVTPGGPPPVSLGTRSSSGASSSRHSASPSAVRSGSGSPGHAQHVMSVSGAAARPPLGPAALAAPAVAAAAADAAMTAAQSAAVASDAGPGQSQQQPADSSDRHAAPAGVPVVAVAEGSGMHISPGVLTLGAPGDEGSSSATTTHAAAVPAAAVVTATALAEAQDATHTSGWEPKQLSVATVMAVAAVPAGGGAVDDAAASAGAELGVPSSSGATTLLVTTGPDDVMPAQEPGSSSSTTPRPVLAAVSAQQTQPDALVAPVKQMPVDSGASRPLPHSSPLPTRPPAVTVATSNEQQTGDGGGGVTHAASPDASPHAAAAAAGAGGPEAELQPIPATPLGQPTYVRLSSASPLPATPLDQADDVNAAAGGRPSGTDEGISRRSTAGSDGAQCVSGSMHSSPEGAAAGAGAPAQDAGSLHLHYNKLFEDDAAMAEAPSATQQQLPTAGDAEERQPLLARDEGRASSSLADTAVDQASAPAPAQPSMPPAEDQEGLVRSGSRLAAVLECSAAPGQGVSARPAPGAPQLQTSGATSPSATAAVLAASAAAAGTVLSVAGSAAAVVLPAVSTAGVGIAAFAAQQAAGLMAAAMRTGVSAALYVPRRAAAAALQASQQLLTSGVGGRGSGGASTGTASSSSASAVPVPCSAGATSTTALTSPAGAPSLSATAVAADEGAAAGPLRPLAAAIASTRTQQPTYAPHAGCWAPDAGRGRGTVSSVLAALLAAPLALLLQVPARALGMATELLLWASCLLLGAPLMLTSGAVKLGWQRAVGPRLRQHTAPARAVCGPAAGRGAVSPCARWRRPPAAAPVLQEGLASPAMPPVPEQHEAAPATDSTDSSDGGGADLQAPPEEALAGAAGGRSSGSFTQRRAAPSVMLPPTPAPSLESPRSITTERSWSSRLTAALSRLGSSSTSLCNADADAAPTPPAATSVVLAGSTQAAAAPADTDGTLAAAGSGRASVTGRAASRWWPSWAAWGGARTSDVAAAAPATPPPSSTTSLAPSAGSTSSSSLVPVTAPGDARGVQAAAVFACDLTPGAGVAGPAAITSSAGSGFAPVVNHALAGAGHLAAAACQLAAAANLLVLQLAAVYGRTLLLLAASGARTTAWLAEWLVWWAVLPPRLAWWWAAAGMRVLHGTGRLLVPPFARQGRAARGRVTAVVV